MRAQPLLLLAVPRSGSSWTAEVLGQCKDVSLVFEPDDAFRWPEALAAKAGIGNYPSEHAALTSPAFRRLWQLALDRPELFDLARSDDGLSDFASLPKEDIWSLLESGTSDNAKLPTGVPGPDSARVIKTVGCSLCAKLVVDWTGALPVVIRRDLKQVVSSWSQFRGFRGERLDHDSWTRQNLLAPYDIPDSPPEGGLALVAWTAGVLDLGLRVASLEHGWKVFRHQDLLERPHQAFDDLATFGSLVPTPEMHEFIDRNDHEGTGFEVARSKQQLAKEWKERLSPDEWKTVQRTLEPFERLDFHFQTVT